MRAIVSNGFMALVILNSINSALAAPQSFDSSNQPVQQSVVIPPIVDGDFADPTTIPGVGKCYNQTTGVWSNPTPDSTAKCDNYFVCEPLTNCAPSGIVSPGGCTFRKTQDYLLVGTCVGATNTSCKRCAAGSTMFCMIYEFFAGMQPGGACINSCGDYQVHFGGQCKQ